MGINNHETSLDKYDPLSIKNDAFIYKFILEVFQCEIIAFPCFSIKNSRSPTVEAHYRAFRGHVLVPSFSLLWVTSSLSQDDNRSNPPHTVFLSISTVQSA